MSSSSSEAPLQAASPPTVSAPLADLVASELKRDYASLKDFTVSEMIAFVEKKHKPDSADTRYTLTATEKQWCADLIVILNVHGIARPTDYMLAHFAIVFAGNTEKAARNMLKYNRLWLTEYEYEEAKALESDAFGYTNEVSPGFIQVFKVVPGKPTTHAYSPWKPGVWTTLNDPVNWKKLMWDYFLLLDATYCDLDEIRKGNRTISNAKSIKWENFNAEFEGRVASVMEDSYPMNRGTHHLVDAPQMLTQLLKMCELFHDKEVLNKIAWITQEDLYGKLGYTKEEVPTTMGGEHVQDVKEWVKERLELRAESVRRVKLE